MKLKFWGVRGSINTPLDPEAYTNKLRSVLRSATDNDIKNDDQIDRFIAGLPTWLGTVYGGNTSCVTVSDNKDLIIFDAGTGIRKLGNELLDGTFFNREVNEYNIIFSHLHLDHINGLPFFAPVHISGKKINFFSHHPEFKKMLELQQNSNFFPVSLESRPSEKKFTVIGENEIIKIGDFSVQSKKLNHPNSSYSYSVVKGGTKIVYATDAEYTAKSGISGYVDFYRDADVLIFDSQYNFNELARRYSFGHSTAEIGVDAAVTANAKKLLLFHHNHDNDDEKIVEMYRSSVKYLNGKYPSSKLEIIIANEGMEFNFGGSKNA
ncbi:MAG: MBL fold metallo-hydrolase [Candidatus Delongbacteria bacterium]|nr:MBL fold metallo-hydrolase [Candidatus Delongbacteria bacterium]